MKRGKHHLLLGIVLLVMGLGIPVTSFVHTLTKNVKDQSNAELVYSWVWKNSDFTEEQLSVVSEGVRYSHGHTFKGTFWPTFFYLTYPPLLTILGVIELSTYFDYRKKKNEGKTPHKVPM